MVIPENRQRLIVTLDRDQAARIIAAAHNAYPERGNRAVSDWIADAAAAALANGSRCPDTGELPLRPTVAMFGTVQGGQHIRRVSRDAEELHRRERDNSRKHPGRTATKVRELRIEIGPIVKDPQR